MKKDAIFTVFLVSISSIALIGFGFLGGRYESRFAQKKQIDAWEHGLTLGALLKDTKSEAPSDVVHAYEKDRQDPKALTGYSWSPLNLPTPFVGGAPLPGLQENAHINHQQFRNERELVIPKPEGVLRVFLTGGSTAYSSGASGDDRTIGTYLEQDLNAQLGKSSSKRIEVFTLATPGWASTHERIAIENLLSELQPDLVISLSGNNDVHWAQLGRNVLWFRTYFDAHVFSLIQNSYWMAERIRLEDNIPSSPFPIDPKIVAERLMKNVNLIVFTLSRTHTPYLFVLQPTLAAVSKPLTAREAAQLENRSIRENARPKRQTGGASEHTDYFQACYQEIDSTLKTANNPNLHYLNLDHVFESHASEEIFIDSYHFGDRGNQIVAQAIAEEAGPFLAN